MQEQLNVVARAPILLGEPKEKLVDCFQQSLHSGSPNGSMKYTTVPQNALNLHVRQNGIVSVRDRIVDAGKSASRSTETPDFSHGHETRHAAH